MNEYERAKQAFLEKVRRSFMTAREEELILSFAVGWQSAMDAALSALDLSEDATDRLEQIAETGEDAQRCYP